MDLYSTLGVSRAASFEEVKRAYKRAVSASHPDKHGGAPEMERRLRSLNAAYAVLSNPTKRAAYDRSLAAPRAPRPVVTVDIEVPVPKAPPTRWDWIARNQWWLTAAFFAGGLFIALFLSATAPSP